MENTTAPAPDDRPVVEVYDTTLRDGSQREGISYTLEDKLRIADRLDSFGVAYIEGGWPGSNPKDLEFFERGRDKAWKHAKLSAFGMTRRANSGAEDDKNLQALILAGTPACTVVGKTSTLHVTEVVRTTLDEVAGDAALIVPCGEPDALAVALDRLFFDTAHTADLRQRGLTRAAGFTWRACAEQTLDFWRRALSGT